MVNNRYLVGCFCVAILRYMAGRGSMVKGVVRERGLAGKGNGVICRGVAKYGKAVHAIHIHGSDGDGA